ncbi:hypothetical protein MsAg5_01070 [Methanosarcinaceae archaeon Ag5]|uniref:Uncharacterized protein n=1 Tax=Methanolapillus africanus TaxID=3028297 RepID=A0AAE4MIP2_9EURY|nr:hypothetical protein [Methanosarcinaceae archaeon Ag5]
MKKKHCGNAGFSERMVNAAPSEKYPPNMIALGKKKDNVMLTFSDFGKCNPRSVHTCFCDLQEGQRKELDGFISKCFSEMCPTDLFLNH